MIFWVCHVKKYFQNAMSMILDFNLNLIFWVSNWVIGTGNIINQTCIKYWNFLKKHVLQSFIKHFSGDRVNQVVHKYLNC